MACKNCYRGTLMSYDRDVRIGVLWKPEMNKGLRNNFIFQWYKNCFCIISELFGCGVQGSLPHCLYNPIPSSYFSGYTVLELQVPEFSGSIGRVWNFGRFGDIRLGKAMPTNSHHKSVSH